MFASILSIGDELTLGQSVDTNAAQISAKLLGRGVPVALHLTVPDDRNAIVEAMEIACDRSDLLIMTGGLGPTDDDLTRFCLADFMGVDLSLDHGALAQIENFFSSRNKTMPQRNQVQAMRPNGAMMLENPVGTAPGIRAEFRGVILFALPGPPREMHPMLDRYVLESLPQGQGRTILTHTLQCFGEGESNIAEKLAELTDRQRNPLVGTTFSNGVVSIRIRSDFPSAEQARQQLDQTTEQVRERLGTLIFSEGNDSMIEQVARMLSEQHRTVVTAESCTAGLLGKLLTDPPGASTYYLGGWNTYTYDAKEHWIGVDHDTLHGHGAVSEPVARMMVLGALQRSAAHLALSITGIAGPEGGTDDKPVGTVWIALAWRDDPQDGPDEAKTIVEHHHLIGDRSTIRDRAANTALNLLRRKLQNLAEHDTPTASEAQP